MISDILNGPFHKHAPLLLTDPPSSSGHMTPVGVDQAVRRAHVHPWLPLLGVLMGSFPEDFLKSGLTGHTRVEAQSVQELSV